MSLYCTKCGARKVLIEENTLACPKCDGMNTEMPQVCDYCHAHLASSPSDHGTWICDACIRASLVATSRSAAVKDTRASEEVNAHAS